MNRHNDALRTGGRPVERDDSALRALVARDSRRWTRLATTQAARRSLITSPGDLPPSARKAIRHLKQHRALASYCTNFNLVENRVSVAKRQREKLSDSPNFGDCPRIADRRDPALARRARRLAHKGDFGDCPRIQASDYRRIGRFHRNIFSKDADFGDCPRIADGRDPALARRARRLAHKSDFGDCPRIQASGCRRIGRFCRNIYPKTADIGDCPRIPLKKPVWASSRLARRVPLPRFEQHIDKVGKQYHKAKGE